MVIRNRNTNKRMNWFDRQFLRAQDFTDEQDYHLDRGRRHNRRLHTPGVAEGLLVNGAVGSNTVTVTPGMAINPQGLEIVLPAQVTLTLPTGADRVEFYILYGESESDPSSDPGVIGNTRINEAPTFVIRRTQPSPQGIPADGILLAEAQLNSANGRLINNAPNNGVRIFAAAVVDNDITVFSLTLKRNGVPAAQWPRLSCSAANQAALENASLRLDANREIFFADNGQIRSANNFHRLVFNRVSDRMELHEFGDILFLTGNPPTERMRILGNGNVGIGTANPVEHLEISNPSADWVFLRQQRATGGGGGFHIHNPWRDADGPERNRLEIAYRTSSGVDNWGQFVIHGPTGNVGIGAPNAEAKLQIVHLNQDANGNTLILGPTNQSNLRLGYNAEYSWIQSHGSKPLAINPVGNNVGIGTIAPQQKLSVSGAVNIDQGNTNNGAINPGLTFGSASGEGISSKRTAGGNQFGLDFYTNSIARLRINNAGQVSLGAGAFITAAQLSLNGPIGFRNGTDPMMFIYDSGSGNPPRPIVAHSPAFTNWGLQYVDATDTMVFQGAGTPVMSIGLTALGIGSRPVITIGTVPSPVNLVINGSVSGTGKGGYVMDKFINNLGETLEEGDVVILGDNQAATHYGVNNRIPIPEVDLAQEANDTRVCGIVCEVSFGDQLESSEPAGEDEGNNSRAARKGRKKESAKASQRGGRAKAEVPDKRTEEDEAAKITKIAPGQIGFMVTLGAFAYCKVDADIDPIKVGDLLTTSPTRGHAQKVQDPAQAIGAIIGKALGTLKKGKGRIPIMVMLQ